MKHIAIAALAAIFLAGCAQQLEGAYVDVTGAPAFKLANGKYFEPPAANPRVRARHLPLPYKVDGSVLIVGNGEQRTTFAILPGGALQLDRNGQVFTSDHR